MIASIYLHAHRFFLLSVSEPFFLKVVDIEPAVNHAVAH